MKYSIFTNYYNNSYGKLYENKPVRHAVNCSKCNTKCKKKKKNRRENLLQSQEIKKNFNYLQEFNVIS